MALVLPNVVAEKVSRFVDDHFYWIEMMGRLQPGVSMAQAEGALRAQFSAFAANTAASPKDAEVLPDSLSNRAEPGSIHCGGNTRSRYPY